MSKPDFDTSRALMRELGFVLQDAKSYPEAFGDWYICATAHGKSLRLVWDGRDGVLIIQEPSLNRVPDDWADRWIAGQSYAHELKDLRDALLSVLKKWTSP